MRRDRKYLLISGSLGVVGFVLDVLAWEIPGPANTYCLIAGLGLMFAALVYFIMAIVD